MGLWIGIGFIAIVLLYYFVNKLLEERKKAKIAKVFKDVVSWIVANGSSLRAHTNLLNFFLWQHKDIQLPPEEYRLNENELEIGETILKRFLRETVSAYFSDRLALPKGKYNTTTDIEYIDGYITRALAYMFLLNEYCKKHRHYPNTLNEKHDCPREDFTVVFYKMYYFTQMYCENCKELGMADGWTAKWIKGKIDSRGEE